MTHNSYPGGLSTKLTMPEIIIQAYRMKLSRKTIILVSPDWWWKNFWATIWVWKNNFLGFVTHFNGTFVIQDRFGRSLKGPDDPQGRKICLLGRKHLPEFFRIMPENYQKTVFNALFLFNWPFLSWKLRAESVTRFKLIKYLFSKPFLYWSWHVISL